MQVEIFPWVHSLCNNLSHSDALRPILVPDISAADILFAAHEKAEAASEAAGSSKLVSDKEASSSLSCDPSRSSAASVPPPPPQPAATVDLGAAKVADVSATGTGAAFCLAATGPTPGEAPLPAAGAAEVASMRDLSMCAGEFLLAYDDTMGTWDCFLSCFFIDTAPNILEVGLSCW